LNPARRVWRQSFEQRSHRYRENKLGRERNKTRRRISYHAQMDLVFASSQRVKCQMPCSRMEPQGCERHRWVKLRGRNERERVSQSFRSLSATHLPRAHDIGAAFHFAVCSPGSLASFRHASSLNESMNRSLDVFRFRGPITNADPDHRFAVPCRAAAPALAGILDVP